LLAKRLTVGERLTMHTKFRTIIEIQKSDCDIDYQSPVCFIGSCFTDNIGGLLEHFKFKTLINPFGVLFNPASIARLLHRSLHLELFSVNELVFHNGLYHLLDLHGDFSCTLADDVLKKGNIALQNTHNFLKNCSYLITSWGTSWVFEHVKNGEIVSNCHKIPSTEFNRRRLEPDEIDRLWRDLISQLLAFNPTLQFIFTVSPVRHLKDTAHGNQLSKSVLLLAIERLLDSLNSKAEYFPAYEIVLDELRDYRFFADDMVHVSPFAIDYVFERFQDRYFSNETKKLLRQVKKIIQATEHRFLHQNFLEQKMFALKMLDVIKTLESEHLDINFQDEIKYFESIHALNE
jgi:hypothetical protein